MDISFTAMSYDILLIPTKQGVFFYVMSCTICNVDSYDSAIAGNAVVRSPAVAVLLL